MDKTTVAISYITIPFSIAELNQNDIKREFYETGSREILL